MRQIALVSAGAIACSAAPAPPPRSVSMSGSEPALVTTRGDATTNRCAIDPAADIAGLAVDPPYVLAYRSGKDSGCSAAAPHLAAPGAALPGGLVHRQGIQRLRTGGKNYLLVSGSVEGEALAGFEIVELASHRDTGSALGPGAATPTTAPNCRDRITRYHTTSMSPNASHAGGMQVSGHVVIVPLEDPKDREPAAFYTVDLSDPARPAGGVTTRRVAGETANAGKAALTRTADGRLLVMVFGRDSRDVEVFTSSAASMPDGSARSRWRSRGAWATGLEEHAFQNLQLVTKCEGDDGDATTGPLFVLGTSRDDAGADRAILYRVTLDGWPASAEPTFRQVASATLACRSSHTGDVPYCDFDAGAGLYVDDTGRIVIYGVERDNAVFPGDGTAVGVREFPAR